MSPAPLDTMSLYSTFTEHPNAPPTVVFPNNGMQILAQLVHLIAISILSYCFARRTESEDIWSWKGLAALPWPRLCTILVFVDSWLFIFCSGLLIYGSGLSLNALTCNLGILSCVVLYVGSKLLIYCFLVEKVYIVWSSHSPNKSRTRWASPIWRVCMGFLSLLGVIFALLIWGRVAIIRDDRACVIGLTPVASITLLSYDLFMTIFLTALFVWPLWNSRVSSRVRRVASRTLIASVAALTTSTVNIALLTVMHGKQLGWVCLSSCGTDVAINAMVLYWVTIGARSTHNTTPADPIPGPNHHSSGPAAISGTGNDTVDIKSFVRSGFGSIPATPGSPNGKIQFNVHAASVEGNVEHVLERAHRDRARTHFVEAPPASLRRGSAQQGYGTNVVRMDDMRKSVRLGGGRGFGDKLRSFVQKKEQVEPEEHTMSVQVTVTTEMQLESPNETDEKYAASSASSDIIRAELQDRK